MSTTTIFPALPPVGGFVTQQVLRSIPGDKSYSTKYKPLTKNVYPGKQLSLQGFSPVDSKPSEIIDSAKYRNSFLHNLCLEMLQEGFHLAFCELFNLVEKEKKAALSENNCDNSEIPIEESQGQLTYLKEMLIAAELAKRQGRSEQVYTAYLSLARFFDDHGDFRLADHFYLASFNTSQQIRGDGRRKEAEANCNLGSAAERKKDNLTARKLYEEFHSLTLEKSWSLEDGTLLHKHACDCLQRVYIILSELIPAEHEDEVLQYLHRAYDVAKEGGDESEIGKVGYLIGNKYDFYGDQETAVKYHLEYLELCKSIGDDIGMGKACQALAYANQRQGNMEEAVDNLKRFLQVSERSGEIDSRREACCDLGALYNHMGKYEQSCNYYKNAFKLSQNEDNLDEIDASKSEYAVALAHGLLTGQVECITQNNTLCLERMLYWKSERVQGFSKDERTYGMYELLQSRLDQIRIEQEIRIEDPATLEDQKEVTFDDDPEIEK